MEEASRFVADYHGATNLSLGSIIAMILGIAATFGIPRRYVFLPLILVSSFVPDSQRVVVGGLDFAFMRLMMVVAWVRLAARSELRRFSWSPIDTVFCAWILWRVVATVVRTASFGSLANQLGHGLDAFGIYFLARMLLRSWRDLDAMIVSFAFVSIPVAASMAYEASAGWNFASVFSGREGVAVDREGDIRAMCGYAHPIVAGAFWAGVLPLITARLWNPAASRAFTVTAIAAALVCVLASSSSTPLLGTMIAVIAGGVWVLRRHMNWVRWAMVGMLVFLEIAMEKPIWHLFQRVSNIGLSSSTGYHRYRLFDAFVNHFTDWALLGLNSTAYWGRQLDDVTNTFIVQAVRGGLVGLVLFLALFFLLFQRNGRMLRTYRGQRPAEIYLWALGVSLFTHVAMMNAMSYLSQMLLPWYACFGMIAAAGLPRRALASRRKRARRGEPEGEESAKRESVPA